MINSARSAHEMQPAWLHAARNAYADLFKACGLPTRKHEHWQYADVQQLSALQNQSALASTLADVQQHPAIFAQQQLLLPFINGYLQTLPAVNDAYVACSLQQASVQHADLLASYFTQTIDGERHPLALLNAARFTDGLFLYLPDNCRLNLPIQLFNFMQAAAQPAFVHHVIILGKGAHLELLDTYHSAEQSNTIDNISFNVFLAEAASFNYYKLQQQQTTAMHTAYMKVQQGKNSVCRYYNLSLGAQFSRDDVVIDLQAEGAQAFAYGLYHLQQDAQYNDHHLEILHNASHTQSSMLYKGIVEKKARAVFNGRLLCAKDMEKINAQQANHNLLLDQQGEIYAKPELEIYAQDVQCKHGATIGDLSAEALFYLRSRGLSADAAIRILLAAFRLDILHTIDNQAIKSYLRGAEAL